MALSGEPLKDPQHEASASATIDSPLCKPPTQQCPGELQLVGTQCKCPENTRRTADDHCRGATPPASLETRTASPDITDNAVASDAMLTALADDLEYTFTVGQALERIAAARRKVPSGRSIQRYELSLNVGELVL